VSALLGKKLRLILIIQIVVLGMFALFMRFQNDLDLIGYQFFLPLEKAQINSAESNETSLILFIGHVYGDPNQENSLIPSETLIESVGELNRLSPGLIILMGDLSEVAGNSQWEELEENFLSKVNAPVINAPGNHDFVDRNLYLERFGQAFYSTTYQNSQIIVLDSLLDICYIKDL
jgi:predicted MPP superfamily phosphohydrolase